VAGRVLLEVRDLRVRSPGAREPVLAGLDLDVRAGECLALVGPSGCGKSTLCRALLDLLPPGSELDGSIRWEGRELVSDRAAWRRLRGCGLGLVLQDHRHALDPVRRVGAQIAEVLRRHRPGLARREVPAAVDALLGEVQLAGPARLADRFPHQLSGGQRQRACLAAALAAGPRLLLADEPTTALDLVVQLGIVALLADLVRRRDLALVLVTHDRDLVPLVAARVLALAPGAADRGTAPARAPTVATGPGPVRLAVRGLTVTVAGRRGPRTLVQPLDLDLRAGETLGLAGESGAGKTTLARALAGWLGLASGSVELVGAAAASRAARRRAVQLVSQDPSAALDPQQTAFGAVVEAVRATGASPAAARARAAELLAEVDLEPGLGGRRPRALSGGQRPRLQLARALAAAPSVLVADEPASSLDPARRERLLALLRRVQQQRGLALLLISHDLTLLERWCDEVAVILAGHLVELYRPGSVAAPRHPFARDLMAAAPVNLARSPVIAEPIAAAATSPQPPADGCPYAHRCRLVQPACRIGLPPLADLGHGWRLRCPEADRQAR